ncbi:MAG: SH3 domain-containing protein [Azonexus sp.]|uniref:SH3 domain-containing protein n=1 Tax=Azonexus sp. TaxID=1872668 RepID=UPI0028236E78|nr:SH3 domain-containing protein [Azonexus sp.]MDR0775603.1 SH3 domain-containing protein [Azonexus sp.]
MKLTGSGKRGAVAGFRPMRGARWLVASLLLVGGGVALAASADPPQWTWDPTFTVFIGMKPESLRWVAADGAVARNDLDPKSPVAGTLAKGTLVRLLNDDPPKYKGYCYVQILGLTHYPYPDGWIACSDLSAEKVESTQTQKVDPATRWVVGSAVNLRVAPDANAEVSGLLALNSTVKLLRENAGGDYCEVQTASIASGFIACQYLASAPVNLLRLSQPESPEYDPERAFWIQPSLEKLGQYALFLVVQRAGITWKEAVEQVSGDAESDDFARANNEGPWPRNEALERMKAHLAKGQFGFAPGALADWVELKRIAAQAHSSNSDLGSQASGAEALFPSLGLYWWDRYDSGAPAYRPPRDAALVHALEFPTIKPSLFRDGKEIAPPELAAEALSGHFGIVYRQVIKPRPAKMDENDRPYGHGALYDMLSHTTLLTQPIQRVQLFRDGRLRSQTSFAQRTEPFQELVWSSGCEGDVIGFTFGDADARVWRAFGDGDGDNGFSFRKASFRRNPAGSLFAFYTATPLPRDQAKLTRSVTKMNHEATGFSSGAQFNFDLDDDGVPDLIVWEGTGRDNGYSINSPDTDEPWYRLVLVNIDGRWKVLGTDQFGYGCGC